MKNGRVSSRGTSFMSSVTNTYVVVSDDGKVIGIFDQMADREFNFKTTVWVGMGQRFQYLRQVREFVKGL